VQIVDPSRWAVNPGDKVDDQKKDGKVISSKTQLLPGNLCGQPQTIGGKEGDYTNRANKTDVWNTLIVGFAPPTKGTPAHLKTTLNTKVVFDGFLTKGATKEGDRLVGTGSGRPKSYKDIPVPSEGYIYLQSHWGSKVQFKAPVIKGPRR
jgi:hypothetical protein